MSNNTETILINYITKITYLLIWNVTYFIKNIDIR